MDNTSKGASSEHVQSPSDKSLPTPRKLVLCFDGTSNRPVEAGTSVARIFFNLDKDNDDLQRAYYQPGLGTYVPPTKPFGQVTRAISVMADSAFAWFLQDHIVSGYRFLMNNYRDSDKICIFGFSRGAYTARCLAAMISCVGLLRKGNDELIPFAYSLYEKSSGDGVFAAAAFRRKMSRDIRIEFMGLWDTVASVGINNRTLPASLSRGVVQTFRQALALDERRAKFQEIPLYQAPEDLTKDSTDFTELIRPHPPSLLERVRRRIGMAHVLPGIPPLGPSPNARPELVDVSAVDMWFIGCHSDVGGNEHTEEEGLATLPFLWMLQELKEAKIELTFKTDAFWRDSILRAQIEDPTTVKNAIASVEASSRPKTTTKGSVSEAIQGSPILHSNLTAELRKVCNEDIKDPLARGWRSAGWFVLECVPLWKAFYNEDGQRCNRLSINRGRPRQILAQKPNYHWSVNVRRNIMSPTYKPKAVEIPGVPHVFDGGSVRKEGELDDSKGNILARETQTPVLSRSM